MEFASCPVFPWSWWTISAHPSAEMMILLLQLVCALVILGTNEKRAVRYDYYLFVSDLKILPSPSFVYKSYSYQLVTNISLTLLLIHSSLPETSVEKGGWNMIGKKNKVVKNSNIAIPNGSIYFSDMSDIKVIYESKESEEGLQYMLEYEEEIHDHTTLLPVAADLHPYNLFSGEKSSSNPNKEKGCSSLTPVEDISQSRENKIKNVPKGDSQLQVEGMRNNETNWNHTKLEPHPESQQEEVAPTWTNTVNISKSITNSELTTPVQSVFEAGGASAVKVNTKGIMESGSPSLFIKKNLNC